MDDAIVSRTKDPAKAKKAAKDPRRPGELCKAEPGKWTPLHRSQSLRRQGRLRRSLPLQRLRSAPHRRRRLRQARYLRQAQEPRARPQNRVHAARRRLPRLRLMRRRLPRKSDQARSRFALIANRSQNPHRLVALFGTHCEQLEDGIPIATGAHRFQLAVEPLISQLQRPIPFGQ